MAKAEFKVVGTSPARMGGIDRVIGKGVYGIDLMLKDQLHGAILRSQYAHAKIVSIDTSEAKKIPGVHAVVTADDAPNVRYGRSYIDRHILARGKVRFMGDPVAAVAADIAGHRQASAEKNQSRLRAAAGGARPRRSDQTGRAGAARRHAAAENHSG